MRMLLLIALLCAPLLYSQADPVLKPAPKAGQADIADGENAFEEGRMQDAVDAFTRALKAQPKNDEVLAYRAAAYVALGKLDDALADAEEAIKLESAFSLAWNTRGYLRWMRGDFKGAVSDYTAAIAYAADDRRVDTGGRAQMYQNRGVAWQDAGNTDRALLDFDTCIELQPANPAFYENRGLIYVDKQLFDVAFKDFDRALELDSKNARGYVNRAWAARLMGDFEQAVRDYSQALRLKPDYGQALIGRGYAWIGWERPELAKKDFEAAEKLDVTPAAQTGLGELALTKGDHAAALSFFAEALKNDETHIPALRAMTFTMIETGKLEQALLNAEKLCKLDARSASAWHALGLAHEKAGRHEQAVAALNRSLELNPVNADVRALRVQACARRGDFAPAKADVEQIAEQDECLGWLCNARVTALMFAAEADESRRADLKASVIEALTALKGRGEPLAGLKDDADFAALKDVPEFTKLVG